MRVNALSSMSGLMGPSGPSAGPSSMVDQIVEAESAPIASSKQRREQSVGKKTEFQNLGSLLTKLQSTADAMKMPSGFRKLMVESSHPDIVAGTLSDAAEVGSYELEVAGLARADKQLAFGFPDKDQTSVGFGYMRVGVGDGAKDIVIDPGSTLKDVAARINDAGAGVRASIINTGAKNDPFRLMVASLESGEEAVVDIDPDTTFTEFKNQVKGQDLNVKFEGVDVKRPGNALNDLIDGVNLKASKAAPGTNVTINVKHDVDKTAEGVRDFVKNFNEIQSFGRKQSQVDPATGRAGQLSGDSSMTRVTRSLQSSMSGMPISVAGLSTNPKTGELQLDENKLKEALNKDFDGVAKIFASSESGPGLAARMSDAIKSLQDRTTGAVATRMKGLDQRIKTQDQDIARKEERMTQRRAQLERTFAALDSKMAGLNSQGQFLSARMGAQGSADGGGKA